jgi:hypothetical protein
LLVTSLNLKCWFSVSTIYHSHLWPHKIHCNKKSSSCGWDTKLLDHVATIWNTCQLPVLPLQLLQETCVCPTYTKYLLSCYRRPLTSSMPAFQASCYISTAHKEEDSPFWEANSSSASQEIPHILFNPKVQYRTYNSLSLVPVLSPTSPVHTFCSYFIYIFCNIILPSTPTSFLRLPPPKHYLLLPLLQAFYTPYPSHPHPILVGNTNHESPHYAIFFSPLSPCHTQNQISPQQPTLKHHLPMFSSLLQTKFQTHTK